MSTESKEIVEHAAQIISTAKEEFEYRAAVNRAYYGAFLTARDLANVKKRTKSVHWEVINYYESEPKISNDLKSLKKKRQEADYQLDKEITINDAENCYTRSKGVLDKLLMITLPEK